VIQSNFKTYLVDHGAATTAHSGHTLWDHLSGVHRILEAADCEEYVCTAGLFHSVYGTQSFKHVTIVGGQRVEIQNLIGQRAEALVWAFCSLPRPNFFEASLKQQTFHWFDQLVVADNKERFWEDLVRIECANMLEQKSLYQFPFLAKKAQEMRMLDREGFSV
jgi:hypothetical protein